MRNQKGITLIALVITIIVLLILAGVSIAMLTGENGILNKASKSKAETGLAQALEVVNLELNTQLTNVMDGDDFDSKNTIQTRLDAAMPQGYTATISAEPSKDTGLVINVDGTGISEPKKGEIVKSGNTWKVNAVKGQLPS